MVAAGFSFSDAAGEMATIVKLTRTLMIIPITLILALWRTRKVEKTDEAQGINYSLAKNIPHGLCWASWPPPSSIPWASCPGGQQFPQRVR